ncbi:MULTISPECIES: class I SAM-dependent methyltransferase [unclassified Streptomyces]|uniref:class I SAM-dependent methyltransferase n=1 Tax=unclassified Streptomyces TaxID=2593676 RepID=UPI00225BDA3F|nr:MULTISPECIES: class I SAM-dependent methyltransferase [unclassified Streptomyces]MCX5143868.1 class I SAM-dependent methyltransferase [Streptomyces sp. NBC_00338]WRZ68283.1 class I SAM-dependent methyltransferase [Streptomyces sp. NBC_01257]WSU62232.1 class I SAM-dependent methyltransferase [Streptomyces sp. NBC_01104]
MESIEAKNRSNLINFYTADGPDSPSIFEVWENGGSRNDSVTPSTYSPEYRDFMSDRLIAELERNGGGLLSLGCGNAAVEACVAERGFRVLAVDAMEDAVTLARAKGLDAICADIYRWEPDEPFSVIYIDGVLGHLLDEQDGLNPILKRIRGWLAPQPDSLSGRAALVASNDAPGEDRAFEKAPKVNGFHWLSADYMKDQAIAAGFETAETAEFRYVRPISGERVRAIMTGYVTR